MMTSRDCRVALLVNFIPPYRISVFRALRAEVRELQVLISTPVEANRPWLAEWADLPVVVQRSVSVRKRWKRPGGFRDESFVHVPYDTIAQLRRFQPDVILSGELGVRSWLAAAYKQLHPDVRLLLWATVSERTEQRRGFAREQLRPALLRQADGVLVNGASGARYITAQGIPPVRVTRVPQTADVAAFSAMPVERPDAETISLVYAGLLIPRKGILEFLRLLAAWAERHPHRRIEFHLAGDGPQRAALDAVPRPPNLVVRFLGNVPYDELPSVYGRSSILVLPTLEDEWGVVVNEAMAAGLPILGSLYSQAVEELVVDGETGWTFIPDDQRSAHAALDAALNTSACDRARMARTARAHACALTPTRIAREIATAIDRVITPSPVRA
jgi:glycosyltransferase involved in cell wall biosynthesis